MLTVRCRLMGQRDTELLPFHTKRAAFDVAPPSNSSFVMTATKTFRLVLACCGSGGAGMNMAFVTRETCEDWKVKQVPLEDSC